MCVAPGDRTPHLPLAPRDVAYRSGSRPALRGAVRRLLRAADVHPGPGDTPARHGRADRGRWRRGVRRLRLVRDGGATEPAESLRPETRGTSGLRSIARVRRAVAEPPARAPGAARSRHVRARAVWRPAHV